MAGDDIWADDLLDRREFAEFLTRTLVARTASISAKQGQRGWTVALDAGWGAGKSFFVERWVKHLRLEGHPVVFFDAWENDIGEEAATALMAEINEEMDRWIDKLPRTEVARKTAADLVVKSAKNLRKSLVPVAKVVASGLLKKAIGIGIDEMLEAGSESKLDAESLKSSAEEALDKAFEVALEEQRQRKSNIRNFKNSLVGLIELIESDAGSKSPFFVFVDELDRCRPTYAISLLEEVKHIFGMDKVCFVVSTNMSQLRHSVGAVYGSNFDSEMYLKRFFDQSIELPDPNFEAHVRALFEFHESLNSKDHFTAMPADRVGDFRSVQDSIAWVFLSFSLDARSQKQVFRMAESVAAAVNSKTIHTAFLFFLCCLYQKNQELFSEIERGLDANGVFRQVLKRDVVCSYSVYQNGMHRRTEASLSSVIAQYLEFSRLNCSSIIKLVEREGHYTLNGLMAQSVAGESRVIGGRSEKPIIAEYFTLVRYAGYLK